MNHSQSSQQPSGTSLDANAQSSPSSARYEIGVEKVLGERFAPLTFPRLRKFVAKLRPPWLAAVATQDGQPVGLALGYHEQGVASLLSVFVDPAHRRTGVGAALLRAWEAEAQRLEAQTVTARFTDALPRRDAFRALLRSASWGEPSPVAYRLTGIVGRMTQEVGRWKGLRRVLAQTDIAYGPFVLTPEDDPAIERLLRQPEAEGAADPRPLVAGALSATSCTIRQKGKLAGWIVSNRASTDIAAGFPGSVVIDYREMYLDPRLWRRGVALAATYLCFVEQEREFGAESIATYNTHPGRPRMVALTSKRYAPMALHVRTVRKAKKELTRASGEPRMEDLESAGPTARTPKVAAPKPVHPSDLPKPLRSKANPNEMRFLHDNDGGGG